eukprot:8972338-Alexandrium_andersonii.AAC.1
MSASLVGSEMCIRDRVSCDCPGGCRPLATPRLALPARQRRQSEVARAVSYTHLTLPTICSV